MSDTTVTGSTAGDLAIGLSTSGPRRAGASYWAAPRWPSKVAGALQTITRLWWSARRPEDLTGYLQRVS